MTQLAAAYTAGPSNSTVSCALPATRATRSPSTEGLTPPSRRSPRLVWSRARPRAGQATRFPAPTAAAPSGVRANQTVLLDASHSRVAAVALVISLATDCSLTDDVGPASRAPSQRLPSPRPSHPPRHPTAPLIRAIRSAPHPFAAVIPRTRLPSHPGPHVAIPDTNRRANQNSKQAGAEVAIAIGATKSWRRKSADRDRDEG